MEKGPAGLRARRIRGVRNDAAVRRWCAAGGGDELLLRATEPDDPPVVPIGSYPPAAAEVCTFWPPRFRLIVSRAKSIASCRPVS